MSEDSFTCLISTKKLSVGQANKININIKRMLIKQLMSILKYHIFFFFLLYSFSIAG